MVVGETGGIHYMYVRSFPVEVVVRGGLIWVIV